MAKKSHLTEDNNQLSALNIIRQHLAPLLRSFGLYILVTMPIFVVSIYMVTINKRLLPNHLSAIPLINLTCLIAMLSTILLSEKLSDLFGRKKTCSIAATTILLLAYPCFTNLVNGSLSELMAWKILLATATGLFLGPNSTLMAEILPAAGKYAVMSIAYNTSSAIFGGTAPIVCVWLVQYFGGLEGVAYYMIAAAAVALMCLIGYKDQSFEKLL
ncbi:hypothetical protein [Candidatus Synchoanobacter obligatus]|uniref:Major facilitator superfamily (MFS) profile domain-containing protein n=1 Tax=Candidatus Synchoanobacter obligatus TaxID=2919597 RepID=A0ABT1L6E9_9GAMM|nr:hypothetical protein [Candidatus Synchoanobacter obligatus]MCP8352654.1 hypothetical protein [Candidatus Synchoanobacter obligatus]